jgi:hypothetical protein
MYVSKVPSKWHKRNFTECFTFWLHAWSSVLLGDDDFGPLPKEDCIFSNHDIIHSIYVVVVNRENTTSPLSLTHSFHSTSIIHHPLLKWSTTSWVSEVSLTRWSLFGRPTFTWKCEYYLIHLWWERESCLNGKGLKIPHTSDQTPRRTPSSWILISHDFLWVLYWEHFSLESDKVNKQLP